MKKRRQKADDKKVDAKKADDKKDETRRTPDDQTRTMTRRPTTRKTRTRRRRKKFDDKKADDKKAEARRPMTRRPMTGRTKTRRRSKKAEEQKNKFEIQVPTNAELAANLKGRLLLVHGELDNNVHPANTLRLVDALIKANKRFDMLYLPGKRHAYADYQPYINQRMMEYFAESLLGDYQPGRISRRRHSRMFGGRVTTPRSTVGCVLRDAPYDLDERFGVNHFCLSEEYKYQLHSLPGGSWFSK